MTNRRLYLLLVRKETFGVLVELVDNMFPLKRTQSSINTAKKRECRRRSTADEGMKIDRVVMTAQTKSEHWRKKS